MGGDSNKRPRELQNPIAAGSLATAFSVYKEHVEAALFSHLWEGRALEVL